jgi:hypothetical protein
MPTVEEMQTAQIQKVAAERRANLDNDPWMPRRPPRPTLWVRPTARFRRVLDGAGGFIVGPTEVDAGDHFIRRRITDEELEIVPPDELQRFLSPPPESEPETAPPAPAPETQPASAVEAQPAEAVVQPTQDEVVDRSSSSMGSF